MKHQASFSLKDKSKNKTKCRLLQFLFGALRVKDRQTLNVVTTSIAFTKAGSMLSD